VSVSTLQGVRGADVRTGRWLLAVAPGRWRPPPPRPPPPGAVDYTIDDPGRPGHRQRYRLVTSILDPIGWSATSVPEPTAAGYVEVLAELAEALVLWRRAEQATPAGPGRSRNALACSCGCGRRIRVARSVLALAPSCAVATLNRSSLRTTGPVDAYGSTPERSQADSVAGAGRWRGAGPMGTVLP